MQEDRTFTVQPGEIVKTGYVDITRCRLACRERMAMGDVDRAFQKHLQLNGAASWPPPNGFWEKDGSNDRFVIQDGRHEYVSKLMLGHEYIFVAWKEMPDAKTE